MKKSKKHVFSIICGSNLYHRNCFSCKMTLGVVESCLGGMLIIFTHTSWMSGSGILWVLCPAQHKDDLDLLEWVPQRWTEAWSISPMESGKVGAVQPEKILGDTEAPSSTKRAAQTFGNYVLQLKDTALLSGKIFCRKTLIRKRTSILYQ